MSFYTNLGVEYYHETPLLKNCGKYKAYDKRKKKLRPCTIRDYDNEIANIYWEDTHRYAKILLNSLVCKSIIPDSLSLVKIGLVIDSVNCWRCKQISNYILGVEIVFDDKYLEFNTSIDQKIIELFDQDLLREYKLGKKKKRYSRTMQTSYLSDGCYHCDALFGDYYLRKEFLEYSIHSSWPESVETIEITYEKYFELTGDVLVFNQPLLQRRLEYLQEAEQQINNLENNEEEKIRKENVLENLKFVCGDLEFNIKHRAVGLELYCGNAFVQSVDSIEEGKTIASGYAKQLQRLKKGL